MKEVVLDVKDKKIGRIATKIADILNGKDSPTYRPNIAPDVLVKIKNVDNLDVKNKKEKVYVHHTGYLGGLKVKKFSEVVEKKGLEEILRRAVYGMLPKNKLRSIKIKKIKFVK